MQLVMYYEASNVHVGVRLNEGVIRTGIAADHFLSGGIEAYNHLKQQIASLQAPEIVPENSLQIAPVVPNPGKVLCIGLNYRKHAAESGMAEPKLPVLFSKFNNSISAHRQDVPMSREWLKVDYEAELGVVIGRTAKDVTVDEALDYVLGYCNCNDLSERALQFVSGQWLVGKSLDGFQPVGPYLVTADEVSNPQALRIRGWLNGELRQDSNTSDMIFSVAECIAYASQYMTLQPGDLISTGTPQGVILGHPKESQVWMQPGDEYVVEVEGLGQLRNRMVERR
jgi:2-keto-4-pentenoate hydratase/2-oxohepta-3-ene-1,7-dioic acid hydratase in catechol pathway